jgi:hypothetical protein
MYAFLVFVNLSISIGSKNASKFCYISFTVTLQFLLRSLTGQEYAILCNGEVGKERCPSSHVIGKICAVKNEVVMTIFGTRQTHIFN